MLDLNVFLHPVLSFSLTKRFDRLKKNLDRKTKFFHFEGRAPRAIPDGLSDLSRTVELASGRISIMPGSGITADNVDILTEAAPQIVEIHSSCSINQETKEESSKLLSFGFIGKTSRRRTKCSEVRRMKEAIYSLSMKKTF